MVPYRVDSGRFMQSLFFRVVAKRMREVREKGSRATFYTNHEFLHSHFYIKGATMLFALYL